MSDAVIRVGGETSHVNVGRGAGPESSESDVGNVESVGTFTKVAAGTTAIPADVESVRLSGYDAAGDGGDACYNATSSEPSHRGKFQAADARWFIFSKGQRVRPEHFGATDSATESAAAIQEALTVAGITGFPLELSRSYLFGGDMIVPAGVKIVGANRDGGLKRIDEIRTTLTSGFAAGTGVKTFQVASTAGLAVGMQVMFIDVAGGTFSPYDPYSHRNPVITAIAGDQITVNPRSAIRAHAAGTVMQTAARGLVLLGNNLVEGITIDGNQEKQTQACWQVYNDITVEGSDCTLRGLEMRQAPSEFIMIAGYATDPDPSIGGVYVANTKIEGGNYDWAGCNAVHLSFTKVVQVIGATFKHLNKRNISGDLNYLNHMDGGVICSFNNTEVTVAACDFEDMYDGVGNIDSTTLSPGPGSILNARFNVTGNTFRNVYRPLHVINRGGEINFTGNRCSADYPYTTFGPSRIQLAGANKDNRTADVNISGNQMRNVAVIATFVRNLEITANLLDLSGTNVAGTIHAITLSNCADTSVVGNRIKGGSYGIQLINHFADGDMDGIVLEANHLTGQRRAGVRGDHVASSGRIGATLKGGSITSVTGVSEPNYVAVNFADGLRVREIDLTLPVGTAWGGNAGNNSATNHNRYMNTINGALEAWTEPYVPTARVITARTNTTVTDRGGGVYRIKKTSGGAAQDADAISTVALGGDFELKLVPPANTTSIATLGATASDPSTGTTGVGINAGISFFSDGKAYRIHNGGSQGILNSYTASETWWITRVGTEVKYIKGGVTPAEGAVQYTGPWSGLTMPAYFDCSIYTLNAEYDVRAFG